jgi:nitrite reductase/ring-hydroxylating ferredoxin subunit
VNTIPQRGVKRAISRSSSVVRRARSCYALAMNKRKYSVERERRKRNILWWIGVVIALAAAYFIGGLLEPGQDRYTIFDPDLYPPGTIQRLSLPLRKGGGMFVVNDNGAFYAIIAKDPYDGCGIQWSKMEHVFFSPCSDHRYYVDGSWKSGSSPGGLARYAVSMQHGNIVIDTETRIEGEPRPNPSD